MDTLGSTVEHITNTLPGRIASATPPLPNSTSSVCAALTTTDTTTSQARASAAALALAVPPSRANVSATPGRTSNTCTSKPARRSDCAMPLPMAPRPITPTLASIPILPRAASVPQSRGDMRSAVSFSVVFLAKPESITVPLSVSTLMLVPATFGLSSIRFLTWVVMVASSM